MEMLEERVGRESMVGGGWIRVKLESEGWCRLQRDWWRDVVVRLVDSEKEK